jgi:hypothetical protein
MKKTRNFSHSCTVTDWHFPSADAPLDTTFEANHRYTFQAHSFPRLEDWTPPC